ncbi:MAG TPA: hypothetical protein VF591_17405 [Pyrinomonadaceae bacterium]|jgi:hypothetical protein
MNSFHLVHYERSQRVTSAIDSQPEDFPEDSKAATLNAAIKQKQARLAELDIIRSSSMSRQKQATAARGKAHKLLDTMVRRVIGTALVFAPEHPDTEGMFVRPQKNASGQTLITDARSLADKAASLVGLFTENGLRPTFVGDMRTYADTVEHSMQLQTESEGERLHANAEMKEVIYRLSELIGRLDVVVRNKYADEPAKLAAWERARRLEKARAHRTAENNAPPPAPQP